MAQERKSFLLRLPPDLWKELEKWAADELRSVNGQIEYLLRQAVARRRAEQPKNEEYTSLVAALKLASEAAELGAIAELTQTVERNPDDLEARYDLALALNAEDKRVEAAEQLVALMKRDRSWNDDAARKKLLEFFEAWGFKDPATIRGRRLLSSLLFS